jgi:ATP-dependent DNA helicase RecQ/Werner syndrome ATP-dependent helicase
MQDQVQRLNGLSRNKLATFLGSSQSDAMEEQRALQGDYKMIYVTPEKLASSGFLDRLAALDVCCVAIDEAHCVSQWGHDFRQEYRSVGKVLREGHSKLQSVPIVALTATAVPRVQQDIMDNLRLRSPHVSKQSFDRTNLEIKVVIKKSGKDLDAALGPLIRTMTQEYPNVGSTIIYAVTRNETEEIASYLQQRCQGQGVDIDAQAYHAGLSGSVRHQVHTQFLTGKTAVVVATTAFGMGIDKPDIRRVIHWGPPKTIEEYYQQIGRAGRDGLTSHCCLYTTVAAFDRYMDDFYLGQLHGPAREATVESIKALKGFALDKETCRRKSLLAFFKEAPPWDRCGNCDNCKNYEHQDAVRDFGEEARLILSAVSAMDEPSMTNLIHVATGKTLELFRYLRNIDLASLNQKLGAQRKQLSKGTSSAQVLKEICSSMAQKGYLQEKTKCANVGEHDLKRSWTVFSLTELGRKVLIDQNIIILLPVPDSLRETEERERLRRERVLKNLEEKGVNVQQLPAEELQKGDGEVIRAYSKWTNYVSLQERMGKKVKSIQLDELLASVQSWRSRVAQQFSIAPASVLPEHVMVSVAYSIATLPAGVTITESDLLSAGVRSSELESLVQLINQWIKICKEPDAEDAPAAGSDSSQDSPMQFPPGDLKGRAWSFAVYKPQKKTGKAAWESSYERFQKGESPQAIAMAPENGRPIQVATVAGHIQDGFLLGRPVDLHRLSQVAKPPSRNEWAQLEQAAETAGMDPAGDPSTSGVGGGKFTMTDFLRPIMGDAFMETPREERSEQDTQRFSTWCNSLKWYLMMKRTGLEPIFCVA